MGEYTKEADAHYELNLPPRARRCLEVLCRQEDWSWFGLAEFLRRNFTQDDLDDLAGQLGWDYLKTESEGKEKP